MGIKTEITGLENLEISKNYIFASNHASSLDIPLLLGFLPFWIVPISKIELKWIPFLGLAMQVGGMIFVDRSSPKRAVKSMRHAAEEVRKGKNIILYPEGTRTQNGELRPFKKGAFVTAMQAGVDLIPIAIDGARDVYGAQGLGVIPGVVKVKYGNPIKTEGLNYKNNEEREMLTAKGESEIRRLLESL